MKPAASPLPLALAFAVLACGPVHAQEKKFKFTDAKDIPIPTEKAGEGKLVELTLEDTLRLAVDNNVDLSVLRLNPRVRMQDLVIAKAFFDGEVYSEAGFNSVQNPSTSPFSPEITREFYDARLGWRKRFYSGGLLDVNVIAARTEQSVTTIAGFPTKLNETGWSVTYTQPLWRSAWWEYGLVEVTRAEAGLAGARFGLEQERQDILLSVVRAYWELVFAREDYRVQFQGLELAQEQLRITRARIAVKDLAARDAVADEAEVARRQEGLIVAENRIRQREDDLRALVFKDQTSMWDVAVRPTSAIPGTTDVSKLDWRELADTALDERPELADLQTAVETSRQALVRAEGDLAPQLDLIGSYNSTATRADRLLDTAGDALAVEHPDWSLRLLFSYPLGNRAARARLTRAELDLEAAQGRVYARKVRIRQEVRDAVRSLKTLDESIRAAGESVRLAENDLDTARHKLRVGTLTFFDVQERNQQLQESRSRLLRNQLDFRIAEAVLDHAQGRLYRKTRPESEPVEEPRRK